MYVVKAVTEKPGKIDSRAFAAATRGLRLSAREHPGILLDVGFDANGDLDRENHITKVENGKQVTSGILPPVGPK
ncbi:MAG: hypothetical protein LH479_11685 [Polaromonas sp.]|nr:hypothetical protein [Polaromonas sp.]